MNADHHIDSSAALLFILPQTMALLGNRSLGIAGPWILIKLPVSVLL